MRTNDIELTVLVRGRPIAEYQHQDQVFVEGRAGSEYEIELRNQTYQRVEAVLSVDGLSVIDGKPAGSQSRGYLVEGRGSIRIPGWMLDNLNVAKFAFSASQQSYAAQTSDGRNNGVIGAMVFREKPRSTWYGGLDWSSMRGIQIGASGAMPSVSATPLNNVYYSTTTSTVMPQNMATQNLGTAFGDATQFATTTVAFERGNTQCVMTMYYDEKRGLRARGIVIERPSKQKYRTQPQAFPAQGCVPPLGWNA